MTIPEKTCGPCNQDCGQSRQCPARLAQRAAQLAAKQATITAQYEPNYFLAACIGSLAIWVVIIIVVYKIFN